MMDVDKLKLALLSASKRRQDAHRAYYSYSNYLDQVIKWLEGAHSEFEYMSDLWAVGLVHILPNHSEDEEDPYDTNNSICTYT